MKRALLALLVALNGVTMQPLRAAGPSGAASTNAPPQILIEAVIFELALNAATDSGLYTPGPQQDSHHPSRIRAPANANPIFTTRFDSGATTNAASGPSTGFGYVARFGDDLDTLLTAFCTERRAKILQRPRIQTSDAVPATLFVGEQPPTTYYGSDVHSGYASIQQLQTGVTLEVTPRLKPDGSVLLDLRLRIDRFEGNVVIQNVGEVPVTSSREAQAQVAVRDRDTLLLGGLVGPNKKKSISYPRFPKDLPVPGALFSRASARLGQNELMVLVRPTLLPRENAAAPSRRSEKNQQAL